MPQTVEPIYDERTLRAAKRALDRLNPKELIAYCYLSEGGQMCAVGALYVSEKTLDVPHRLGPGEIGDQLYPAIEGKQQRATRALLHAKNYDRRTIDAIEHVNQDAQMPCDCQPGCDYKTNADDAQRYTIVYKWVCKQLKRARIAARKAVPV